MCDLVMPRCETTESEMALLEAIERKHAGEPSSVQKVGQWVVLVACIGLALVIFGEPIFAFLGV